MKTVAVLGGYGVFGGRVSAVLAKHGIVRVVGRDTRQAERFARRHGCDVRTADVSDRASLTRAISGADIVVHAAGPFQGNDYRVAQLCIDLGIHYLDLADARQFVTGIGLLDDEARAHGLCVLSGASSVPSITSALVRSVLPAFARVERIQIALSPGNQNPRGASTIAAILTYLGKPIRMFEDGRWTERPGWSDRTVLNFPPPVGRRAIHVCDVPDLDLFPPAFGAHTVRFGAGVELDVFNRVLSMLGRFRQRGRLPQLPRHAQLFRRLSLCLYPFGSKRGALAVWVHGSAADGTPIERRAAIVTDDDGPATPSGPSIVLACRILDRGAPAAGAFPCVGFFTLEELMEHLRPFGVWSTSGDEQGWAPSSSNTAVSPSCQHTKAATGSTPSLQGSERAANYRAEPGVPPDPCQRAIRPVDSSDQRPGTGR